MTDTTTVYADIVKWDENPDGTVNAYGRATSDDLDLDKQICDSGWLNQAMPEWFKYGNVREQHSPIAAGVGRELTQDGTSWDLKSHVVDLNSARKVKERVLKGYSIGIRSPRVIKDAKAPGGRIVGGEIVEVSLVDRPANPTCQLMLAKALKPGPVTAQAVDAERHLVKVEELHEDHADTGDIEKRKWSAEERRRAAKEGHARPDGSFPIETAEDVAAAVQVATTEDRSWVKRRAAAVGASDKIPDSWKALDAIEALGVDLSKAGQTGDIRNAKKAIAIIARLVQNEAEALAGGTTSEACDIDLLMGAVKALEWFCDREKKEPNMAHVELADQPATEKAAAPDAAQTAPAEQAPSTPPPAVEKTAEGDEEKNDLTELVKALTAKVDGLEGQLTKAMNAPAPGGPVLTRTTEDTTKASAREAHLTKAGEYDRLAYEVTDPQARAGYLQMAADERAAAS